MITIIGAGPAGNYLAYLLAKQGKEVTLVEEHSQVGSPVQCTGILTHSVERFIKPKREVIANRMDTVHVLSRNNSLRTGVDEFVMWRNLFDRQVAEQAVDAGVRLLTDHKFTGLERAGGKIDVKMRDKRSDKTVTVRSDKLIGADGPSSPVAKAVGIPHNNRFYIGMQAKVKHRLDMNVFETHFGESFPEFFGWVVPESEDTVRLGLGATKNAQPLFYRFLERVTGKRDIACWESGIIPIHNPRQLLQKDDVYLLGDAASQVKATTGGGIIPSLKTATLLAECIKEEKNYDKAFRSSTPGRELWLHLRLRNFLNRFTDKDYDRLVDIMKSEQVKGLLKRYDRDTPIPLLLNFAFREPRLYSFLPVLLRQPLTADKIPTS